MFEPRRQFDVTLTSAQSKLDQTIFDDLWSYYTSKNTKFIRAIGKRIADEGPIIHYVINLLGTVFLNVDLVFDKSDPIFKDNEVASIVANGYPYSEKENTSSPYSFYINQYRKESLYAYLEARFSYEMIEDYIIQNMALPFAISSGQPPMLESTTVGEKRCAPPPIGVKIEYRLICDLQKTYFGYTGSFDSAGRIDGPGTIIYNKQENEFHLAEDLYEWKALPFTKDDFDKIKGKTF